jgi:hypothetical protein
MTFLLFLVLLVVPSLGHGAAVIYDISNLSIGLGTVVTTSPANQMGNEVTLAGTERVVTQFTGYYQGFVPIEGTTLVGTPTAIVRFFANDGPDNGGFATPHTLIFQSDPMAILSGSLGIQGNPTEARRDDNDRRHPCDSVPLLWRNALFAQDIVELLSVRNRPCSSCLHSGFRYNG